MAAELEAELRDGTREVSGSLVEELLELESEYGVQLPTLHDHISERIVGNLAVNRMTARVSRCSAELEDVSEQEAEANFQTLRSEISDYMQKRLGSGIEPPDWMQQLAREFDRAFDEKSGLLSDSLTKVEYQRVTQRDIDQQIARLNGDDE